MKRPTLALMTVLPAASRLYRTPARADGAPSAIWL